VAVLAVSIGVKLWLARFNRVIGQRIQSPTLAATAADSRNDVISTGAVLVAALLSKATGLELDGWIGLGVALFICASGVGILRSMLNPLLGEAPSEELTQYIARKVLSYDGVLGTHDLMVHDYGPGRCFASVHVEMAAHDDVMKSHDVIDNIERDFLRQDNIHLVIHYDPVLTDEEAVGTVGAWVKQQVHHVSPELSMHDFRMVQGHSHTNLIFDVVVPHRFALSDKDLRARIQQMVDENAPEGARFYTVITVDHSYAPFYAENAADEEDDD
jgi:hypothetical protein